MNYRTLGRTGLAVSEIGMGCEGFVGKTAEQVMEMVDAMDAAGVRCIDLYTPNPDVRDHLGRALAGRRDRFVLQGHLGAVWKSGQYKRTRDMAEVREGFADQLRRLGTDRLEIGMIHYSDAMADWETIRTGGLLDYALELKRLGVVLKRAQYFLTCSGRMMQGLHVSEDGLLRHLVSLEAPALAEPAPEQLSLFDSAV